MHRRVRTLAAMGAREFARTPVLLALLVFLPVYIIGVFVLLVPEQSVPLTVDGTVVSAEMPAFAAAFMTPVTVAILAGIVGLFLMQSSQAADDRLRLAGYRAAELVLARVVLLVVGCLLVATASLAVALTAVTPERLGWFVVATVLAGLTYGSLGVVVGVVLDRLPGVYVMLFAPMVDILLFQNPLATDPPSWTSALPGNYASSLLFEATFTTSVAATDVAAACAYVLLVLVAGVALLYRTTAVE